jgi:hypothetical protein
MFYIDFGDFPKYLFGFYNFLAENTFFFTIFDFPGAVGLEMELDQREELDNFHKNKSS